jgi:hypothetical protein
MMIPVIGGNGIMAFSNKNKKEQEIAQALWLDFLAKTLARLMRCASPSILAHDVLD